MEDSLKLEIQVVVSCFMVVRNETQVLRGISPALQQFLRIYFTAGGGGACLCNHRDLGQPGLQSKILDSQGYSEKSYLEKQRKKYILLF